MYIGYIIGYIGYKIGYIKYIIGYVVYTGYIIGYIVYTGYIIGYTIHTIHFTHLYTIHYTLYSKCSSRRGNTSSTLRSGEDESIKRLR